MDQTNGGEPPAGDHKPVEYPDDPFGTRQPDAVFPPAYATAGAGGGGSSPPHLLPGDEEEPDDEDGMLRMSFMDHLEELRSRLIRALMGFGVAFLACIVFSQQLWEVVQAPATDALTKVGVPGGKL